MIFKFALGSDDSVVTFHAQEKSGRTSRFYSHDIWYERCNLGTSVCVGDDLSSYQALSRRSLTWSLALSHNSLSSISRPAPLSIASASAERSVSKSTRRPSLHFPSDPDRPPPYIPLLLPFPHSFPSPLGFTKPSPPYASLIFSHSLFLVFLHWDGLFLFSLRVRYESTCPRCPSPFRSFSPPFL